ncbi:MAG: hypothetical protein ABIP39_06860, partial [Polyangiaceae bacterium]
AHMENLSEDAIRAIVSQYARLRAAYGEDIGAPELLQPSGEHFPDPFTPDGESVARLLTRMIGYAPIADDLRVAIRFLEPSDEAAGGKSCGSGGCGTGGAGGGPRDNVIELDDGYIVEVATTDVGHGVLLTTNLARSIGALVLMEAGEEVDPRELGALSELAAVATGFGVILLGGAHVYGKSCGGVRVHQATALGLEEVAVALALFVREHDHKASRARAHLETTQKEAFDEALVWLDSNPEIIASLRTAPQLLADGIFTVEPTKGPIGRFFAKRKLETPPSAKELASAASKRKRTPEEERKLAETRALVEEALRS